MTRHPSVALRSVHHGTTPCARLRGGGSLGPAPCLTGKPRPRSSGHPVSAARAVAGSGACRRPPQTAQPRTPRVALARVVPWTSVPIPCRCHRFTCRSFARVPVWRSGRPLLPGQSEGGDSPSGPRVQWAPDRCLRQLRPGTPELAGEPAAFPTEVPLGRSRKERPACATEGPC